ncbi:DUF1684 domain-containing protein [Kineococcus rubinsiae]|uniref:DUF1684 domain-containing protein n=1 Tax=Kineococcus rubinsiae TaxID=2609562 RepID=UPI0014308D85|nr:DUF1684 domain-containing protein [Kineococcus rubinsiae]NIZ91806.1 DUF1684 domain-containing protein [Kineococcus rubinsiae]
MSRLDVLDWRRRIGALYAAVRAAPSPEAGHALWRAGRDELFATHPASPLLPADRAGFTGLLVAPYDPALRFVAEVRDAPAQRRESVTGTDGTVAFERIGRVELPGVGGLDVWWLDQYGGGLFLPIKDPGRGYGGGRYVLDTVKGADLGSLDGGLVVDLNFAYPPSCAYDPEWACPLPSPGNTVDVAVEAGELVP